MAEKSTNPPKLRPVNELVKTFNTTTNSIIRKVELKVRTDIEKANLDRLRKRIRTFISVGGDQSLLAEAHPFFLEYSERILETDQVKREHFFMTMDIKAEYLKVKNEVKAEDEFVFALTDSIREHYKKIPQKEKEEIYNEVRSMLLCCVEYNMWLEIGANYQK